MKITVWFSHKFSEQCADVFCYQTTQASSSTILDLGAHSHTLENGVNCLNNSLTLTESGECVSDSCLLSKGWTGPLQPCDVQFAKLALPQKLFARDRKKY